MIVIIAFATFVLISGAIVAIVAHRFPTRAPQLHRWGGRLLIAGAVLLGLAFPGLI